MTRRYDRQLWVDDNPLPPAGYVITWSDGFADDHTTLGDYP